MCTTPKGSPEVEAQDDDAVRDPSFFQHEPHSAFKHEPRPACSQREPRSPSGSQPTEEFQPTDESQPDEKSQSAEGETPTLGSLPVGARLILRCRADWRAATVAAFDPESGRVVLNVASPTGHTYRVRRPHDAALARDGSIPVLGEGHWRMGLARYDVRW